MVTNEIGAAALKVSSDELKVTVKRIPTPTTRLETFGQLWFANCHVVEGLLKEGQHLQKHLKGETSS